MALLSLQDISLRLGGPPLLENCRLNIERGQKICLLGRNGTGKTSLMRVITGAMEPDSGTILREKDIKISWFTQDIPDHLNGTAFDVIARSMGTRGELLISYFNGDEQNHLELHSRMEEEQAWDALGEIQKTCSLFDIDPHWQYDKLSGGQKRRILLAAALAGEPDLLLLDEPTNHLDVQTILWLEELLLKPGLTLLLVTHDRAFMKRLANRIIELDRGRIFDWDCGYEIFLERKQALLEAQEKQWENFDKKLAQEEQWIRKGIRARRTRNEGRVRALLQMREDKKQRILQQGNAVIQVDQNTRSGKLVLRADDLSFSYGDTPIIKDLTLEITRGEKIGIIGPNGCGKTTLVKLLLKELTADSGRIKMGSRLEITYFDQMRQQLDPEKSVWKNVLPNGDTVTINGRNKNIIAYLQDFLFTPERAKTPVAHLSGGERNRLLLARLFTQPTNFMILDEPTNDLDAETLELLEELLVNFDGTLLLISHDRTFINNVVTSSLVFEGEGQVTEYVGGYDDWLNLKKQGRDQPSEEEKAKGRQQYEEQKKAQKQQRARKLSFKEKRELEQLPALIEQKENEQEQLHSTMADPDFLREGEKVKEATERLDQLEKELEQAYARWEELENIGDS